MFEWYESMRGEKKAVVFCSSAGRLLPDTMATMQQSSVPLVMKTPRLKSWNGSTEGKLLVLTDSGAPLSLTG